MTPKRRLCAVLPHLRMTAPALLIHLLNFIAPAVFLAVVLATLGRFLMPGAGAPAWWRQVAINSAAGVLVLAAGLVWYGSDGKMATYAALVLVCGSVQWLLQRGWR